MSTAEVSRSSCYASRFHTGGGDVFETVGWTKRDARIESAPDASGKTEIKFEQLDVYAPEKWSDTAVNITASKYFRGRPGTSERETSVRQMIDRVVTPIADAGAAQGYFHNGDRQAFYDDLAWLLLHQHATFNSPVWFNVGTGKDKKPQCSACFINSVEDNIPSIMNLAVREAIIFKGGSGAGSDLSRIRSSKEGISGTSVKASGPLSFGKIYDVGAGVMKSGGTTRRAAKMQILGVWHPDINEFIWVKTAEEKKAKVLEAAGYSMGMDGEAYASVFYQNSNFSIRCPDEFMQAVVDDKEWWTLDKDGNKFEKHRAYDIMKATAQSAWQCGDPGVQFDGPIQKMHTCKDTDRIRASNPCGEFLFLDDTACNLASLNLVRFWNTKSRCFETARFEAAVCTMITAMDILVDMAGYPADEITKRSHDYRTLGVGYANLGSLLLLNGVPYDSDEARNICASVTSLMTATAYAQSAVLAKKLGDYEGLNVGDNRKHHARVIDNHLISAQELASRSMPETWNVAYRAAELWNSCAEANGSFRNAQVSVLAPTGTISFKMDCATTGIEPEIALVKYKKLVGGGAMKLVNAHVPEALQVLGYSELEINLICGHIEETGSVAGTALRPEHWAVFDCSMASQDGGRTISYQAHTAMVAAAQPFISGGISKTINMPKESTAEDIFDCYIAAWKAGIKSITIYREDSKAVQPYSAKKDTPKSPVREKLPDERSGSVRKFAILDAVNAGRHKGYIKTGCYPDGRLGEIFLKMAKEGSFVSGLADGLATVVSIALQHGVPIELIIDKFRDTRFQPYGLTESRELHLRQCSSVLDYLARYLEGKFVQKEAEPEFEVHRTLGPGTVTWENSGPPCDSCGTMTWRDGKCHICPNCGQSVGACTG